MAMPPALAFAGLAVAALPNPAKAAPKNFLRWITIVLLFSLDQWL